MTESSNIQNELISGRAISSRFSEILDMNKDTVYTPEKMKMLMDLVSTFKK